ncbi:hypothetical protein RA210_U250048 [Rubrivivax sp. A210]|nr:hypothetical protein RA210_U250048 [Rubrivivax sp. A210]
MLDVGRIKRTVNAEIKWVAAQDHLSIHHLRHSFATRLSFELDTRLHIAIGTSGPVRASWAKVNWAKSAVRTRAVLGLGTDATRLSRRSAWVLCRLLGHAHPRTTFASYVHTLSDLAEHLAFSPAVGRWKAPRRGGGLDLGVLALARTPERHERPSAQPLEAEHVLSMICDLDSAIPPGRLPSRYPISLAGATRLARLLAEAERRLGAADQGSPVAEAREDEDKASTAGPGRSRRKVPLARSGLMNHVLESHLPRLRPVLALFYSERCRAELAAITITEDEFVGMFGSRRNISMVRDPQFRLVAHAISTLSVADSRLRLAIPPDLRVAVAERAICSGWLVRGPDGALFPGRHGMRLRPEIKPDGILLDDERVRHRVVLSLDHGDGANVQTRWELALMLLSIAPLLNFVRPSL